MTAVEANLDGLVGPTHNYSGLSLGNLASQDNFRSVSNPREAALQGLAKMKTLADMGLPQAVLPPHDRPHVSELRRLGLTGTDAAILERVARDDPKLLAAVSSASSMWAANAATVSPSADTRDGHVHFTPANLSSNRHRAIEADTTHRALVSIFADTDRFTVHEPLPSQLADEGAANHTRFAPDHGAVGVELFVYGEGGATKPRRFPGRQNVAASLAVASQHGVGQWLMAQQNPASIDAGVFHNDVIAVGNLTTLLVHEEAFVDQASVVAALRELLDGGLTIIEVPAARISVETAVATYLFNSQLVTIGDRQVLIAPAEVLQSAAVSEFIDELSTRDGPVDEVVTLDLRQSMRNGGGPACLRLRVVLTPEEMAAVRSTVWLTDDLYGSLVAWVQRFYRTELRLSDLADPAFLDESRRALDTLTQLLGLGSLYTFQR